MLKLHSAFCFWLLHAFGSKKKWELLKEKCKEWLMMYSFVCMKTVGDSAVHSFALLKSKWNPDWEYERLPETMQEVFRDSDFFTFACLHFFTSSTSLHVNACYIIAFVCYSCTNSQQSAQILFLSGVELLPCISLFDDTLFACISISWLLNFWPFNQSGEGYFWLLITL